MGITNVKTCTQENYLYLLDKNNVPEIFMTNKFRIYHYNVKINYGVSKWKHDKIYDSNH